MIRRPAVLFIFVVSAVIVGESVLAQGSTDSQLGQSRRELERTDELIVHAREAVRISNSAIAAQALDRAEKLQAGAREAHRNREYPMALSLTRKAREQASLAISNSRLSEQLEGVVQGRLERAREMLERVRETLPTPLSPALATILDQARTNLSQALEFYRQRRFRAAVKLVEQVEQAARRLTSIAQLTNRAEGEFDRRAENVLRLIEHARELLVDCGSAQSREHLEHAEETLRLARRLHSDNQPRAAQMAQSGQRGRLARRAGVSGGAGGASAAMSAPER